ncbi:MAG: hypothetical protein VX054_04670, partial [Pseudomonadota bacterium]|nr:hypothetical protein [Pseudomonadota bacterium]
MTLNKSKLFLLVLFFVLFDNYVHPPGVRPFDLVAFLILIMMWLAGDPDLRKLTLLNRGNQFNVALITLLAFASLLGIWIHMSPSTVIIALGIFTFGILVNSKLIVTQSGDALKFLLVIMPIPLIIQLIEAFNGIAPTSFLLFEQDSGLRSIYAGKFHRATGLFIEPGNFALAAISLASLYAVAVGRRGLLFVFTLISSVLSMSLAAAIVATAVLISPLTWAEIKTRRYVIGTIGLLCLSAAVVLLVMNVPQYYDAIYERLIDVLSGTDKSAQHRFRLATEDCSTFIQNEAAFFPFLGAGVHTDIFVKVCGSNNLAWIIYSLGFLPSILVI